MTKEQEWLSEPNILAWIYKGYDCLIVRDEEFGNLCGYVGLKSDHPWHGKEEEDQEISEIDVHGQISWASVLYPLPAVLMPSSFKHGSRWWLGFRAATGGDYRPFSTNNRQDDVYRNMAFMKAECEKLVRRCQDAVIKEDWRKKVAVSVDKIEAQINQDMRKNLMLQIIDHGYAAFDTYSRGSGGGVRPRYDNLELIQATNMLIDMVKWGKFNTAEKEAKDKNGAEKKPYTCECKYDYSNYGPGLIIGVCENKDPENIRLCKLSTKIWDKLLNSMEDRRTFKNAWYEISDNYEDMAHYCEINTELRAIVFKTLVEESLKRD